MRAVAVLWIALLAAVSIGCATSVSFQVQRPPVWNTLGIQRLAVMPFTTMEDSALQRQAAVLLTNESLSRIQATHHFTLVNSSEVERVRAANGNIENIADALFNGQIISLSVQDSSSQHQRRNRDGTVVEYTIYQREVRMSFSYNLSKTGSRADIVGANTRTNITRSDSNEDQEKLKSADIIIQELIERNMSGLGRNVAPYMITENRRLEKESSKDKDVKQLTKNAEALVKAGNLRNAQEAFLGIYRYTGSFAAAYNVGLLMEAQGNLEGATAFMQRAYTETANPRFAAEITRLQRVMDNAGLLAAYTRNQHQRDRVIALMVDTLPSRMPSGARVALINNSLNEIELVEIVINGITNGFLSKNIPVIDRSSRALLEMERNYQLSGNVSDEEMVRIGREVGVNTFILASITGSGATRRLSVRMLDVERNTIIYQSPQTDEMNL